MDRITIGALAAATGIKVTTIRFYERAETRYLDFIWPQTVEVIDVDAAQVQKRGKLAGDLVTFNEEHPLTLESRAGVGSMDREI